MKNLVLSAFVLAASVPATGCIFVDDDDSDDDIPSDDDPVDEPTQLDVTWSLVSNDQERGCLPGANATATLYACEGTCAAGSPTPFSDVTDCPANATTGTISTDPARALPPGNYIIWVEFAAGGAVYAKSFSDPVTLTAGRTVAHDFEVQIDHGFFDAAWTIMDGNTAVTCEDVGGVDVELSPLACDEPRQPGNLCEPLPVQTFECAPGVGQGSTPMRFAEFGYVIPYALLNANDQAIGGMPPDSELLAPDFEYGNQARDLGQLVIEVD
jgi:hypothetical protein